MARTAVRKAVRRARKGGSRAPTTSGGKVAVHTPNKPGAEAFVDAAKYAAMKKVLREVMPRKAPGLTQTEMMAAVGKVADKDMYPGHTYHWWAKCVELDMETKGELVREKASPLRWHLP